MTGPVVPSDASRIFVSHSHSDNAYCRAFVNALRDALGGPDDAVWYDEHNLGWGNIRRTIERELERRQHFIAILSPAAVESQWVNDEIDAALGLLREGGMRTVAFVTAARCDVPRLLRGYKRVEAASGAGYPPAEAAARVLRFIQPAAAPSPPPPAASPPPRVDLPGKLEPALSTSRWPVLPPFGPLDHVEIVAMPAPSAVQVERAEQEATAPAAALPRRYTDDLELRGILTPAVMQREMFPERLERLGFTAWTAHDPATGKRAALILPPLRPVPAGPFLMGSDPHQDTLALDAEMPQHEVTLPAYQIATFPVTVAEYACFVGAGHANPHRGLVGTEWRAQLMRPDHPVTGVSWYDARDYAAWLAGLTGQPWALPNEAAWEKAARWDATGNTGGGVARTYPWGDHFDPSRCNTLASRIHGTTAVGTYGPEHADRDGSSPYGAQDMAGNVWEWTRTIYDDQAYGNGVSPEDGDSPDNRVLRGGSWRAVAKHARSAHRNSAPPGYAGAGIGFRLALLLAPASGT